MKPAEAADWVAWDTNLKFSVQKLLEFSLNSLNSVTKKMEPKTSCVRDRNDTTRPQRHR